MTTRGTQETVQSASFPQPPSHVWVSHILNCLTLREVCTFGICCSDFRQYSLDQKVSARKFLLFHDVVPTGLLSRLGVRTSGYGLRSKPTAVVLVPEIDSLRNLRAMKVMAPTPSALYNLLRSGQQALERLELVGEHPNWQHEILNLLVGDSQPRHDQTNSATTPPRTIQNRAAFPNLNCLVLRGCTNLTPSCVKTIGSALVPMLRHLDLSWCPGVTESAAFSLIHDRIFPENFTPKGCS
jgi:hypothetical protein